MYFIPCLLATYKELCKCYWSPLFLNTFHPKRHRCTYTFYVFSFFWNDLTRIKTDLVTLIRITMKVIFDAFLLTNTSQLKCCLSYETNNMIQLQLNFNTKILKARIRQVLWNVLKSFKVKQSEKFYETYPYSADVQKCSWGRIVRTNIEFCERVMLRRYTVLFCLHLSFKQECIRFIENPKLFTVCNLYF